ncbi:MAG: DUF1501 domain-containing protein [Fimbriimonadales bacterium]|nr:DUF1501 domain-containing protein [Fimbriimonadales bacterium]MDW8051647.1 DUF1501 domain-containing protein [Armatimonadota bacterium]
MGSKQVVGAPLCECATGDFWAAEISRRQFLKAGFTLVAVGLAAPPWLAQIAYADSQHLKKGNKLPNDRVLVVLQLTGGNDGLNTVVPYRDALYYKARPTLAIPEARVVPLEEPLGLHPALQPLKPLYEQRVLAVVQNVGYPNPNRSHFRSMEIWQTADPDGYSRYGWLGKYLDTLTDTAANPVMAISFTQELPLALHGRKAQVPCFASLADLQVMTNDPELERTLQQLSYAEEHKPDSPAAVIRHSTRTALEALEQLRERIRRYQPRAQYGNDPFAQGLQQAAQIIATSPHTRILYVSVNGFDTHAAQASTHERLLSQFANAVSAFYADLQAMGKADKVLLMVFSEFGRRVHENGSLGTDHGAAAPMFLIGGRVRGGLHGDPPDLHNLDSNNDLRMQIDFRRVYATALTWLGGDPEAILGKEFAPMDLVRL